MVTPSPTGDPPPLGERKAIADHELLRPIASGSYGEVWLARSAVGTLRAVKLVRRDRFERAEDFEREFKGLQRFEPVSRGHDGLVDILQIGRPDEGEWFYYVMELADAVKAEVISNQCSVFSNQSSATSPHSPLNTDPLITDYSPLTLRAHFRSRGALPADEVIALGLALTAALAHLHGQGLVHRDIKPSNILFVGGVPKLADAGLVAAVDDARSLVGTVGYLAPEGPGSPRADLYALGKVLYEAAFGKDRLDFPQLPPDLASRPDHARLLEINAVIATACAHDPKQRYASADALLADLKLLDAGKSVKRRRSVQRGWTWTWKTAAALALVSLAFVLIRNERDRRAALVQQNRTPWEKAGTTDQAAWQAYKRAFQMGSTYTTDGLSNAIREWERATELDPNYLAAWSTLSVTITIAVGEGHFAGTNLLPRAKVCAEKAIALNPKEGAPYISLAQCNLALDYDFAQAEPLFRKALELGPPHWSHRNNFAWAVLFQGRFSEAGQLFQRVRQENPEQGGPYAALGILSWIAGSQADGLALFEEAIRLQPDRPLLRSWRGDFLWAADQRPAAAQDWLRQVQLGGFPFLDRDADGAALRQVLNERGPEAFLERLIALAEARQAAGQFVAGFDLARLHAHAGNRAPALDHLETALAEHSGPLLSVKVDPAFKILRDEPRFHAVLRRLKLEK